MHPLFSFVFVLLSAWNGLAWHDEPATHSHQDCLPADLEEQKKDPNRTHELITKSK